MLGGIISSVIGAGAGLLGGKQQASAAKDAAHRQMDFQEEMSNSAYQRAMKDMRKAGLNPILAYQKGGASTPSGASYSPPNIGEAAMSGAASAATISNMRATNTNLRQQNHNLKADESMTRENIRRLQLENEAYSQLTPEMRAIVLSGGGVSSAAAAAGTVGRAARGLATGASRNMSRIGKSIMQSKPAHRLGDALLRIKRSIKR